MRDYCVFCAEECKCMQPLIDQELEKIDRFVSLSSLAMFACVII